MKPQYLMYSALLVCTCALCVQTTEDRPTEQRVFSLSETIKRCSNYLSKLVANICDNKYLIVKRDTTSVLIGKLMPKDLQDHMNKRRLRAAERWRRVRRQIATECCDNPCTISNLILYCSDTAKLVKERPEIFDYA